LRGARRNAAAPRSQGFRRGARPLIVGR